MKQIVVLYVGTSVIFNTQAEINPGGKCRLTDWFVLIPGILPFAFNNSLMFLCWS